MPDYTSFPIDHPDTGLASVNPINVTNSAQSVSNYTFATKDQIFQGHHLRFQFVVATPLLRKEAKEWYSFLMALKRPTGTFNFSPPLTGTADGSPSGSPSVDSISSDNETLTTSGWDASITDALVVGDWIEVNSELKAVMANVDTDGSGNASITVWPPFRSDPTGSNVIFDNPSTQLSLVDGQNSEWNIQGIRMNGMSFEAREDF